MSIKHVPSVLITTLILLCPIFTTLLYSSESNGIAHKCKVIFVHGYMGDPNTWLNDRTNAFWPEMFTMDEDLIGMNIAVSTYGYESNKNDKTALRLDVLSENFQHYLKEISYADNPEQIYIVAHSYGGLVAMGALDLLYEKDESKKIFEKVRGIFLIASPFEGRHISKLVKVKYKNAQIFDTDKDALYSNGIRRRWKNIFKNTRIKCDTRPSIYSYGEGKRTWVWGIPPYWGKLVPTNSMLLSGIDEFIEFEDKDHNSIVKPADNQDEVYRRVKNMIIENGSGRRSLISNSRTISVSIPVEITSMDTMLFEEYFKRRFYNPAVWWKGLLSTRPQLKEAVYTDEVDELLAELILMSIVVDYASTFFSYWDIEHMEKLKYADEATHVKRVYGSSIRDGKNIKVTEIMKLMNDINTFARIKVGFSVETDNYGLDIYSPGQEPHYFFPRDDFDVSFPLKTTLSFSKIGPPKKLFMTPKSQYENVMSLVNPYMSVKVIIRPAGVGAFGKRLAKFYGVSFYDSRYMNHNYEIEVQEQHDELMDDTKVMKSYKRWYDNFYQLIKKYDWSDVVNSFDDAEDR